MKRFIEQSIGELQNGDIVYETFHLDCGEINARIIDDEAYYIDSDMIKIFKEGVRLGNKGVESVAVIRTGEDE
jgi:hypothetical protein